MFAEVSLCKFYVGPILALGCLARAYTYGRLFQPYPYSPMLAPVWTLCSPRLVVCDPRSALCWPYVRLCKPCWPWLGPMLARGSPYAMLAPVTSLCPIGSACVGSGRPYVCRGWPV